MSNEIEAIKDPGLPAHVHRKADTDPVAEKRAERQVAILFLISALGTLLFIFAYYFVPEDSFVFFPALGNTNAHQLLLGLGLAIALFFIGAAAIHWAKTLMPDEEVIAMRHTMRSDDEDRDALVATVKDRAGAAGLGRRSLIKRSMGLSLGLIGLSPLVLLRDLGPLPGDDLSKTSWEAGSRLVTDPGDRPIRPEELEVGAVAQVLPELRRKDWVHEGIIAFSKICSHMGCAVALYEQTTKHLLCPCHQSTFDVPRAAKVIFGPAARALPQLAITVDSEGYLIAQKPFDEPVGPSFWGRLS